MQDSTVTKSHTVDLTPTWTAIMPALIQMIRAGGDAEKAATEELMDLARNVDKARGKLTSVLAEMGDSTSMEIADRNPNNDE